MKKNVKNEELQSRREFFKKAAKGALPIVAALAFAGAPNLLNAAESRSTGCDYTCKLSCANDCYGHCKYACKTTCSGTCSGSCKVSCSYSSK